MSDAATSDTPEARLGRADLHIHTLASDGISDVETVLDHAERRAGLDIIAIADHERIDAAVAAQRIAEGRGMRVRVIVGEEVTTRNGHLVGLFLTQRIRPWGSMRDTIARVHDQGGIAIVAHPLVPYPLCASRGTIIRLFDGDERVHPDALEAFNPTTARMRWSRDVPQLATDLGVAATASSDAHRASQVGRAVTEFPGTTPDDLRAAISARATTWTGTGYPWTEQLGMFGHQLAKNGRAIRDELVGKVTRNGTGRDLGYPGGRRRPIRFDAKAAGLGDPEGDES